jgi:hypothetical protein
MGDMSTDSELSIKLMGKKRKKCLEFLLLEFHVRFVVEVYASQHDQVPYNE